MAATTKQAHQEVVAARRQLGHELDELRVATRSAVDIPAKIKRNPVQTVGLIGGAGFLAVGGPKRVLQAVGRRVRPTKKDRFKGILPKDVEKLVDRTASNAEEVRQRLEQDFYDWMSKKRPQQAPANARQSFWKTYDSFLGPLGALGTKALAERLFAADAKRTTASGEQERPGSTSTADRIATSVGKKLSG